jgi:hypothetical protein
MPRFGSDANSLSQSIAGVTDEAGNQLVDTSVDFAASPLGVAARAQALFGIANAQFNLTPPDPTAVLDDYENTLPYWSVENLSDGRLTAYSVFDNSTNTWGVELNPSAGSANDSITLKTRSYLLNDDNLTLRQKAFLTLSKSGTAAGTTQFNIVMTAEYFDANDASLSGGTAYAIGTALDTATFTTINGFTTSGGTAVGASALYVDIKVTLTCTANVTGSAKATLKSLLLQTSTGTTSQSFIISETFTSSTTWTRPTSVNYLLAAVVIGGGGGGGGGGCAYPTSATNTNDFAVGGGGGGGGGFVFSQNLFCGSATALTITVGAGGAGGAGTTRATSGGTTVANNGAAGGATTISGFSHYGTGSMTGGGGSGGVGTALTTGNNAGGIGGTQTRLYISSVGGAAGSSSGGDSGDSTSTPQQASGLAYETAPFFAPIVTAGSAGGAGVATGGSVGAGGAVGTALANDFARGGGGGGAAQINLTVMSAQAGAGTVTAKVSGGGFGGGGASRYFTSAGTYNVTGGNGSNATWYGSGGGGGGAAIRRASTNAVRDASSGTVASGSGGNGFAGLAVIWYVG